MRVPKKWFRVTPHGLYCIPGDFYIDPIAPVPRAIISHGHSDHAFAGHKEVIAHPATCAIMQSRYGADYTQQECPLFYYDAIDLNGLTLYLLPAGHVLGSAQIVMEYEKSRVIFSGDYKKVLDPTCEAFAVMSCQVFITEATFALPIFNHPAIETELEKLLNSMTTFPNRSHLLGVYGLGKCQRVIKTLRNMGYLHPIYLHEGLRKICELYSQFGIELGELPSANKLTKQSAQGKLILCPPSALHDRWSRRFTAPVVSMASGWMQIRARAKQKGIELPLIISDHADWNDLINTIKEINPEEVWVTHGREEALVYHLNQLGYQAQALHLLGYEEHKGYE